MVVAVGFRLAKFFYFLSGGVIRQISVRPRTTDCGPRIAARPDLFNHKGTMDTKQDSKVSNNDGALRCFSIAQGVAQFLVRKLSAFSF